MIKLKNYLNYINLSEEAKLEDKIATLTGLEKSLVLNMKQSELVKVINSIREIDYDMTDAYITLPVDYGKLKFGTWVEIEHYQNDLEDNYRVAKEIASVILTNKNDLTQEQIEERALEILELDVKVALPLIALHVKKKTQSEASLAQYTIKRKAVILRQIQRLTTLSNLKSDNNGAGTRLLWIFHKVYSIMTKCLLKLQIKYLRTSLSRIS